MAGDFDFELTYQGTPFVSDRAVGWRMPPAAGGGLPAVGPNALARQQDAPDLYEQINRTLDFRYLEDFVPLGDYVGREVSSLPRTKYGNTPGVDVKVGDYHYPSGASRWSVFRGLATSRAARAMVAACVAGADDGPAWGPGPFVMQGPYRGPGAGQGGATAIVSGVDAGPANYRVATDLFLLPPRPLGEHGGGVDGLYLVTLVDERYWLQYSSVSTGARQETTWDGLILSLAQTLGIDLNFYPADPAYGQPEPDSQLWTNFESAALLLDACAAATGRTVVRNLDGTYTLQDAVTAARVVAANRQGAPPTAAPVRGDLALSGLVNAGGNPLSGFSYSGSSTPAPLYSGTPYGGPVAPDVRLAGGELFGTASGADWVAGDLSAARNAAVPAAVQVTFPQYVLGDDPVPHFVNPRYAPQRPSAWFEDSYGDVFAVTVPVTSGGPYASGATGTSGYSHTIKCTAKALYSGEVALGDAPLNASGLTAMALAFGLEHYTRALATALDEAFPGTYAWQPEALHDLVWRYSERARLACCRVLRTQWNDGLREAPNALAYSGGALLYAALDPGVTLGSGVLSGFQNTGIFTLASGTLLSGVAFTNAPYGVGGRSVAQSWRDTFSGSFGVPAAGALLSGFIQGSGVLASGPSSGSFFSGTLVTSGLASGTLLSGGLPAAGLVADVDPAAPLLLLGGVDYLPTRYRWRARVDQEVVLFEGTSGGVLTGTPDVTGDAVEAVTVGDPAPTDGFLTQNLGPDLSGNFMGGGLAIFGAVSGVTSGPRVILLAPTFVAAGDPCPADGLLFTSGTATDDGDAYLYSGLVVSGGYGVTAVYRGVDGTAAARHYASGSVLSGAVSGGSVLVQIYDGADGVNRVRVDRGQFAYAEAWTSGGVQGAVLVPQTQNVRCEDAAGVVLGGVTHYSGSAVLYDAAQASGGLFTRPEPVWLVERNGGVPASGGVYDGLFVGYSASGPVAPVYALGVAPSLTVTGYDNFDVFRSATNPDEIDFATPALITTVTTALGRTVVEVNINEAGPYWLQGTVSDQPQELMGEKFFRDGLIAGTNFNDFQSLDFATVVAGGSGYAVGDVLALAGGSADFGAAFVAALVVVTATDPATGAVLALSPQRTSSVYGPGPGAYTTVPANPASTTSVTGSGAGCTLTAGWLGVSPGTFIELAPGNQTSTSYPVPPYQAWGDWTISAFLHAVESAGRQDADNNKNFWQVLVPRTGGASAAAVVGYLSPGGANLTVVDSAGDGKYGSLDAGGTLRIGQTGTAADGTKTTGGIVTTKGSLFAGRPNVTGSRGGNAALASILSGLTGLGLITNSTTA